MFEVWGAGARSGKAQEPLKTMQAIWRRGASEGLASWACGWLCAWHWALWRQGPCAADWLQRSCAWVALTASFSLWRRSSPSRVLHSAWPSLCARQSSRRRPLAWPHCRVLVASQDLYGCLAQSVAAWAHHWAHGWTSQPTRAALESNNYLPALLDYFGSW